MNLDWNSDAGSLFSKIIPDNRDSKTNNDHDYFFKFYFESLNKIDPNENINLK